jgi:hypothetical protein
LKERITSMPYLTEIEKKWIAFQLVYALSQVNVLVIRYTQKDIAMLI